MSIRTMTLGAPALAAWVALATPARAQDAPERPGAAAFTPDAFVAEQRERLKAHRYFSTIRLREDRSIPGVVLWLHEPQVDRPGFEKALIAGHAPAIERVRAAFRASFGEPLGLARRPDRPLDAVCVLQTAGDYLNYSRSIEDGASTSYGASYDRRLRMTVTFDQGGPERPPADPRFPELAAFARSLLHAHYGGPGAEAPSLWLVDGLSRRLACSALATPAADGLAPGDSVLVEWLARVVQDPRPRAVYLLPLADTVALRTPDEWWRAMQERAEAAALPGPENDAFWHAVGAQSELWMHFLLDAAEGRHRAGFGAFVRSALGGSAGPATLKEALGGADLAELDRAYWRWVLARYEALHPDRAIDARVLDRMYELPQPAAAVAGGTAGALDPRRLAPPADDAGIEHARWLARAAAGDVDRAASELAALELRARGGPHHGRIARDVARLQALIGLRDACLASWLASGDRVLFGWGGKKVAGKVVGIEGGVVRLERTRAEPIDAPLAQLDLAELLRDLPKDVQQRPDTWARVYAFVLAGNARAARTLRGEDGEQRTLREDAEEWYPGVLRLGRAAESLASLAERGAPADVAGADATLSDLRRLRDDFGDLALVKERVLAQRELAVACFARKFTTDELPKGLSGRWERLGEDRVRISYDFDRAQEADDFARDPDYWGERRKQYPPLLKTGEQSALAVARGAWRGSGAVAYRLPIAFECPLSLRYDVRYGYVPESGTGASLLGVAACDDGEKSYVACIGLGGLEAVDAASGHVADDPAPSGVDLDPQHTYAIELRLAGERAASFVDGAEVKEIATGKRERGQVVIFVHSDPEIAIERLSIEGRLDVEGCRRAWVAARVADLGL